jgi:hypothetical protein
MYVPTHQQGPHPSYGVVSQFSSWASHKQGNAKWLREEFERTLRAGSHDAGSVSQPLASHTQSATLWLQPCARALKCNPLPPACRSGGSTAPSSYSSYSASLPPPRVCLLIVGVCVCVCAGRPPRCECTRCGPRGRTSGPPSRCVMMCLACGRPAQHTHTHALMHAHSQGWEAGTSLPCRPGKMFEHKDGSGGLLGWVRQRICRFLGGPWGRCVALCLLVCLFLCSTWGSRLDWQHVVCTHAHTPTPPHDQGARHAAPQELRALRPGGPQRPHAPGVGAHHLAQLLHVPLGPKGGGSLPTLALITYWPVCLTLRHNMTT